MKPFPIILFLSACLSKENSEEVEETEEVVHTERRLLHEIFTGSTCGPCFDADGIIIDLLEDNPGEYVQIAYHVGSDPYISAESTGRRMYYLPDEDTYSIPYLHVDGIHGFHPVEVNNDAGYTQTDFDTFAEEPCFLELSVSHTTTEQTVDITVDMLPLQDDENENLHLIVAIIENTTHLNEGTNGLTAFHHVMKKMVPDLQGTAIGPLIKGEAIALNFSYTFQGEYDDSTGISNPVNHSSAHTVEEFEDLSVVAFVQDDTTWKVLQSAWSGSHSSY